VLSKLKVSRSYDPYSSHEAENEINKTGSRAAHQKIILEAVRRYPGHTSKELTRFCDLDRYQIARRLADLENAGYIEKGPIRKCTIGNRNAATWFTKHKQASLF
jgi:DNA-binding MarR family transcriptional regulator